MLGVARRQMLTGTRVVGSPGGPSFCVITSATYLAAETYAFVEPTDTHAFLNRTRFGSTTTPFRSLSSSLLVLPFRLIGRRPYVVLQ